MSGPVFLTVDQALLLHQKSLDLYGGMPGIRDRGGLESAMAQAEATFGGELLHPTLFDQAACYLFHVSMNQPFLDGNKRTGAACALAFLAMNGYVLGSEHDDGLYDLMVGFATGQATKADAARFLRSVSYPWTSSAT